MYWKNKNIDIGKSIVKKERTIVFEAYNTIPEIKKIETSCGCTSYKYDLNTKKLTVKYKPKAIPPQRLSLGFYETFKTVTVYYVGGGKEILKFTTKVYNS